MKNLGQNITEIAIIIALVSIAAIFGLTMLGGNLTSLVGSSKGKVENFDPFAVRDSGGTPAPIIKTDPIGGYDVNEHADGAYTFKVGDQTVTIQPETLESYNTVLQTTGASGLEDLVREMAYVVSQYQAAHPGEQAPLTITFGDSSRTKGTADYTGTASVNATTIMAGDQFVILEYDQTCVGSACNPSLVGKYRIEGTVDTSGNNFNGQVQFNSSNTATTFTDMGDISGSYDGTTFVGNAGAFGGTYNWSLDFNS
jgi:hypothetical protein